MHCGKYGTQLLNFFFCICFADDMASSEKEFYFTRIKSALARQKNDSHYAAKSFFYFNVI